MSDLNDTLPRPVLVYESTRAPGPLVRLLLRFAGQPYQWRAEAFTFDDLARHVTVQGVEPGYRAEQAKENGGRGLDFYSLDRWSGRDIDRVAFTWLTDQSEGAP